jgi:putative hydrolase of the HAD superfamily
VQISWNKLTTLLFDFGGTLDLPGAHWLDRFLALYREAGLDLTREELDHAYGYATRRGYEAGEPIYGYGLRRLVDQLVAWQVDYLLEDSPRRVPPSMRAAAGAIAERFCAQSAAGFAQSRAALAALAPRFRIGVVSNFYGNLEAVLHEAGLLPLVKVAVDSSRVGAFKPDPAIFRAALTALDVRPQEAAMVGDSLNKDCAPAHRLGLATVWLRPATIGYTHQVESGADLVVHNLQELVDICVGAD